MKTKVCSTHSGNGRLPLLAFAKNRSAKDGFQTSCRQCMKRFRDQWYARGSNLQLTKAANVANDTEKRLACLREYSKFDIPKCECCHEDCVEFLTLDHTRGASHAIYAGIDGKHGSRLYRALVRLGFPRGFRVLCNNCNFAHWLNGGCPHQDAKYSGYTKEAGRVALIKRRQKQAVIEHYGAACACCHEDEPVFLTIDHINKDGKTHRVQVSSVYRDLIHRGFPIGFRTLCWNCNQTLGHHSHCPHETPKEMVA